MNCPSKQFIKPVLLAGALGIGLMPAIGDATTSRGNAFNTTCGVTVFTGSNCSLCHSGSPSASNANPPPCPTPTPTPMPVATPAPSPEPQPTTCTDDDGDGTFVEGRGCGAMDCNDTDFDIKPGAREHCTDGVDNNCNNLTDAQDPNAVGCPDASVCNDDDNDGYSREGGQCGPVDCDDRDSEVNPRKSENCGDGFDNNCDGKSDAVDASCQARNDDDDSDDDEEQEKENRRRGHDDDDDRRDSRRSRRESRDRD